MVWCGLVVVKPRNSLRRSSIGFERKYGFPAIIGVIEFQSRGAPHFHFLVAADVCPDWVRDAWIDITGLCGSTPGGRFVAATDVRPVTTAGVATYVAKDMIKNGQKAGVWQGLRTIRRNIKPEHRQQPETGEIDMHVLAARLENEYLAIRRPRPVRVNSATGEIYINYHTVPGCWSDAAAERIIAPVGLFEQAAP